MSEVCSRHLSQAWPCKLPFLQVLGLAGIKGREWERCEGQDMVLSLGKEVHARDKSGEAEGPAIAPCPVVAVGKRKRETEQKSMKETFDPAGGHRWMCLHPKHQGEQGHKKAGPGSTSFPLSQEGQSQEVSLSLPQLPAMVQDLPHISTLFRGCHSVP